MTHSLCNVLLNNFFFFSVLPTGSIKLRGELINGFKLSLLNSPGKNTGVGCHFLLQEIFPTQRSNAISHIAGSLFTILLHWQVDSLPLHHLGSPSVLDSFNIKYENYNACKKFTAMVALDSIPSPFLDFGKFSSKIKH